MKSLLWQGQIAVSSQDRFSPVFQRMIDSPEASIASLRNDSAFEQELLTQEGNHHEASAALPNREVIGYRVFDTRGGPVGFEQPDWVPQFTDFEQLRSHVDSRSKDGRLIQVIQPARRLPIFGIWAPFHETERWNLPPAVREIGQKNPNFVVTLFAGNQGQPIDAAVAAFGLPPMLQRVVAEVVRTGSIRSAAAKLNISYATAREAMAEVAKRMHLPNSPAVARTVIAAGFGILPGEVNSPVQLADTLSLSERQASIALLIGSGCSRDEVAKSIGTSVAVVKKELQTLFAAFGLTSAVDLARLVTEAQALQVFARSIDNAPGFLDPAIEPSRFAIRPNGRGMFAYSDYGPASGKPVLIVHSNWCCRAVPRPLLAELQSRGWRPIAIDRPGFGASSLGTSSQEDPFSQAVADVLQVLHTARIDKIAVIARCGAQFVHAFKTASPARVGAVVLVSPTPQASALGKRVGTVGALKEAYFRSPRLVEMFFRVVSAQFSFDRVMQLMRSVTRGSRIDQALCDDPQFMRDRFRALRPFACGNYRGGILEELVINHGGWKFEPLDVTDWAVLQGDDDAHNSVAEVQDYWCQVLPAARFETISGEGRFMTSSNPALVVDQLEMLGAG